MRVAQGNKYQALKTVLNVQFTLAAVVFMIIIREITDSVRRPSFPKSVWTPEFIFGVSS